MSTLPRFPKPHQLEGIVTLTARERANYRRHLFDLQCGICACGCGQAMCWEQGRMETATLEHTVPRSAGCRKNDSPSNLECWRWDHNMAKGSRRTSKAVPQVTVIQ